MAENATVVKQGIRRKPFPRALTKWRTQMKQLPWLLAGLLLFSGEARAAGKAEGACVIRDTTKGNYAPVYRSEGGSKTEAKAERGDCFGGITTMGLVHEYHFERKNGRVHIIYLSKANTGGTDRTAWMDEADLEFFTYECGCGTGRHQSGHEDEECSPLAMAGIGSRVWNTCFKEARDKKMAELAARWAQGSGRSVPAQAGPASADAEKPLSNEDVIALVQAGLGDDLVIAKIQQARKETLDVSTAALVKLKKDGVSKATLEAMVKRAGQRK